MINIVLPLFILPHVAPVGRIFVYVFPNKQSINQAMFTFPTVALCGHVKLAAQSLGDGCQSCAMATLLNSLSFAFTNLFLPKYRVEYYDYIVKWCSGI